MQFELARERSAALSALPFMSGLDQFYPGFETWFMQKVLPGVVSGKDTLLLALEGEKIAGVALGKRSAEEVKLRCVRVAPAFQSSGLGIRLIDKSLELLEHEKPRCTVSEELLGGYSRAFIKRYGFALTDVRKGLYRPGKLEYCFND